MMEVAYEITGLRFRDAIKNPPKRNGYYLVLTDVYVIKRVEYTVEAGWNTTIFADGKVVDDFAFRPGAVLGWCEVEKWDAAFKSYVQKEGDAK